MDRKRKDPNEKGAIDIIEESFHLLKRAPARVLASYYLGSLPFILGLLYFWADMSKSAYAYANLAPGAFVLCLLFIFMKTCQAVFAHELRALLIGDEPPRRGPGRLLGIMVRQTIVQSSGLFILPLALIALAPFGYTYAFYQNLTALDSSADGEVRGLIKKSMDLSRLWPKQNHVLIWALSPYLMMAAVTMFIVIIPVMETVSPEWTVTMLVIFSSIYLIVLMPLSPFGMVIALNIAMAILIVPQLLMMFAGIQTVFSNNPMGMINSTFFAVVCGLTYLCMDPLVKAAYVLRCFYGESLHTGRDLSVELKRLVKAAQTATIVLVLLAGIGVSQSSWAGEDGATPLSETGAIVSPDELDEALDNELHKREYAWRMPRIERPDTGEGIVGEFLGSIASTFKDWGSAALDWVKKAFRRLKKLMPDFQLNPSRDRDLSGISNTLMVVLYLLVGALLCVAAVMLWRIWKRRNTISHDFVAEAIDLPPDLEDESTTADELLEDEWLALARELMEKGQFRLALRAAFLAGLSHLARRKLIHIAKFKSNRDYKKELLRHAHEERELLDIFSRSTAIYESIWYGMHEATGELLDQVISDQERLGSYGR